jgi:hypothetical protein
VFFVTTENIEKFCLWSATLSKRFHKRHKHVSKCRVPHVQASQTRCKFTKKVVRGTKYWIVKEKKMQYSTILFIVLSTCHFKKIEKYLLMLGWLWLYITYCTFLCTLNLTEVSLTTSLKWLDRKNALSNCAHKNGLIFVFSQFNLLVQIKIIQYLFW